MKPNGVRQPARDLFDVAREVCHEFGLPWTDPRTGVTMPPPVREFVPAGKRPLEKKRRQIPATNSLGRKRTRPKTFNKK